MPYPGDIGAGFRLGQVTNTFADTTARDAYFASNPTRLAEYDNDQFFLVRIGTGGGPYTYFQRLNSAWVDVTPVLQGIPGEVASLTGVTVGHVPYKLSDGTFGDSGAQVLSNGIFQIPGNTLGLGDAIEISDATDFALIHNNVSGNNFFLLDHRMNMTTGSSRPFQPFVLEADIQDRMFQNDRSQQITASPLSVTYTTQLNAITFYFEVETFAAMTNAKLRISDATTGTPLKFIPGPLEWDDDDAPGFNLREGVNRFHFFSDAADDPANGLFNIGHTPLFFQSGQDLLLEVRADNVALLGNSAGLPWFLSHSGDVSFRGLAYLDEIVTGEPMVMSFDISSVPDKSPDAPFTLSGAQTFTYQIVNGNIAQVAEILQDNSVIRNLTDTEIAAGTVTETVNSVTLTAGQSTTFTLRASRTGGPVDSRSVTIRVPEEHERAYVWAASTQNGATQDLTDASVQSFDVTNPGATFTVTVENVADGDVINILYPANRPLTSIAEGAQMFESLDSFTETTNVRTIGSQQMNVRSDENGAGQSVTFSAQITVGGS